MRLQREQKRGGDIFREYSRLLQVLRLIKRIIYKKFYFLPHSFLALLFIYYINTGKETRKGGGGMVRSRWPLVRTEPAGKTVMLILELHGRVSARRSGSTLVIF